MAQTSWKTCGTAATVDETGDLSTVWVNPTNAQGAADSTAATQSYSGSFPIGVPNYLKCTNFGFTTSDVPSGATINGIEFRVTKQASVVSTAVDSQVQTYQAGVVGGSNLADISTFWPTTFTAVTYGSSSQLWGRTWTDSDVRLSTFGVGIVSLKSGKSAVVNSVDCVECRITYTVAGSFSNKQSSAFLTFMSALAGLLF